MDTERNVLLGALALQDGLISARQLSEACAACLPRGDDIAGYLLSRGWIRHADHSRLLARIDGLSFSPPATSNFSASAPVAPPDTSPQDEDSACVQSVAALPLPPAVSASPVFPSDAADAPRGNRDAPPAARYRRLHVHASGGLGRVWLARDLALERNVALKEMRPEVAHDPNLRRRFLVEARVTGQLEHPGIVPVYELLPGSPAEPPSYVMRFIQGRTLEHAIHAYHAVRRQGRAGPKDLHALLNTFTAVCNAVAYAHSRGILHRDLKSSNVILGDFGEVMVVDWGMAKVRGAAQAAEGEGPAGLLAAGLACDTRAGTVMGTPAYMAPEQAAGRTDRIDERSDIYSLGAILYEILAGRPPFTSAADGYLTGDDIEPDISKLLDRIQTQLPERPSQLQRGVPRALEAVCLRALAKAPSDRFASATELAREVQNWLADEPVASYPDPLPVRLGRWARRHRTLVTALAVLLAAAVVALAASTALIGREQAKTQAMAEKAQLHYEKARGAVDRFFIKVSEDRLLHEPGMQPLRNELLEIAREYYDEFVKEADDGQARSDLAETLRRLARVSNDIGRHEEALRHADRCLAVLGGEAAADGDERPLGLLHNLRGAILERLGRDREAKEAFLKATPMLEKALAANAADIEADKVLAFNLGNLGVLAQREAKRAAAADRERLFAAARGYLDRSLQRLERLARERPLDDALQDELAASHANLAALCRDTGDLAEARARLQRALAIHRALVDRHPHVFRYRNHFAKSNYQLGVLYGRDPKAEGFFAEALRTQEKVAAANPNVPQYQVELASIYLNLGTYHYQRLSDGLEHRQKAAECYRAGEKIYDTLRRDYPGVPRYAGWHGIFLLQLANLTSESDPKAAAGLYTQALHELEQVVARDYRDFDVVNALGVALWSLAEIEAGTNNWRPSLGYWLRALQLGEAHYRPSQRHAIVRGALETLQKAHAQGYFKDAAARRILSSFAEVPELRAAPEFRALRQQAAGD